MIIPILQVRKCAAEAYLPEVTANKWQSQNLDPGDRALDDSAALYCHIIMGRLAIINHVHYLSHNILGGSVCSRQMFAVRNVLGKEYSKCLILIWKNCAF